MGTRTFVNERVSFSPKKVASRGFDIPLVLVVVALVVFGLIMLYSASYDFSFNEYGSATYMFGRQLRWLALGAVDGIRPLFVRLSQLAQDRGGRHAGHDRSAGGSCHHQ